MQRKGVTGLLLILAGLLAGCDLINPEEDIPAYLHIDSMAVRTAGGGQEGTSSHKITDVWVRVGNNTIGVYEMPATIPVLQEGNKEVTLRAGIKNNGIANTRGQYPFYVPVDTTVNLQPKKIDSLGTLTTQYADNISFDWLEGFEDSGNISVRNHDDANVHYQITRDPDEVFEGNASLKAEFKANDTNQFFEVKMLDRLATNLPLNASMYVELNFKTNIEVTMGLIAMPATSGGVRKKRSKLILNETGDQWEKIYINIKRNVQRYAPDKRIKVFFGATKSGGGPATFYMDNAKLIHD